jgi:hypothetical protein
MQIKTYLEVSSDIFLLFNLERNFSGVSIVPIGRPGYNAFFYESFMESVEH